MKDDPTTRRHILEDRRLNIHRSETLSSHFNNVSCRFTTGMCVYGVFIILKLKKIKMDISFEMAMKILFYSVQR
jgi:hypothetical protein